MHYLSANRESETPSNFLFVDTESSFRALPDGSTALTLKLWTAIAVRIDHHGKESWKWNYGNTADEFWEFFDTRVIARKPLWVFAHNAKHDFTQLQLWDQFDNGRLQFRKRRKMKSRQVDRRASSAAVERLPWFVKCESGERNTVWIADTLNFWPAKLEELGRAVDLPKLHIDFERCTEFELLKYCWRDCEIVARAILRLVQFVRREGIGNWRVSAAGLSMQSFRHLVMDHRAERIRGMKRFSILIDNNFPLLDMERSAYLGGRIEAFRIGAASGEFYRVDVASMYPAIMRNGCFPVKRLAHSTDPDAAWKLVRRCPQECAAVVRIDSKAERFPLRAGKRQIHASGQFWTTLCGPELARAVAGLMVRDVDSAIRYECVPLFREWVDYWWKQRQRANKEGRTMDAQFCKLIMNSLHGKFAQHGIAWSPTSEIEPFTKDGQSLRWGHWLAHDMDRRETVMARSFAGSVQVKREGPLPEHYFPAISAFITAGAREHMRKLIELCPDQSVFYLAVDALIVDARALECLKREGEVARDRLGKLKVEGPFSEIEIVSQGCYRLGNKWTACGHFGRARTNEKGEYIADDWTTDSPFDPRHSPVVVIDKRKVDKPQSRPKGKCGPDGWVKPPHIVQCQFSAFPSILELIQWQAEYPF